MARWQLSTAHYIHTVNPAEWEYKETDRDTQEEVRTRFVVPRYLDAGRVVVKNAKPLNKFEFEIVGDPTPDMMPLDAEAQAISDTFMPTWSKMGEFQLGGGTDAVLNGLAEKLEKAMQGGMPVYSQPLNGVSQEQFTALQNQVTELMKQNAELVGALLNTNKKPPELAPRRT
jgi:hypothetical protein